MSDIYVRPIEGTVTSAEVISYYRQAPSRQSKNMFEGLMSDNRPGGDPEQTKKTTGSKKKSISSLAQKEEQARRALKTVGAKDSKKKATLQAIMGILLICDGEKQIKWRVASCHAADTMELPSQIPANEEVDLKVKIENTVFKGCELTLSGIATAMHAHFLAATEKQFKVLTHEKVQEALKMQMKQDVPAGNFTMSVDKGY